MKRALSAYLRSGKKLVRPIAVVILTLVLFGLTDTSMPTGQVAAAKPLAAASLTPIKHVVFIIKENRTFDNYFGTFPGANGATKFTNVNGKVRPLNHTPDSTASGIGHRWQHARLAWNNGRMNQFALIPGAIQNGVDVADSQLYESDIPNYWAYARTYALADKFFSSIMANSFPNHLFTIAAVGKNVDDNPFFPSAPLPRWGCDAPAGTLVRQRQANGTVTYTFPCFRIKTLGALLTEYGISWKYYAPPQDTPGYQWSAYNAVYGIRQTAEWGKHVVDPGQFEADVASGNLPAVSWLVPDTDSSEHAPHSSCMGENWTVQKINAIMNSPALWATTAIIVVWDDFGGFYDHVPPPRGANALLQYGFRVPALVISPYARPGYVDHKFYTFTSVLGFVEKTFGLPPLNDLDRQSNKLFTSFNWAQSPLPPLVLQPRECPLSQRTVGVNEFDSDDPE